MCVCGGGGERGAEGERKGRGGRFAISQRSRVPDSYQNFVPDDIDNSKTSDHDAMRTSISAYVYKLYPSIGVKVPPEFP